MAVELLPILATVARMAVSLVSMVSDSSIWSELLGLGLADGGVSRTGAKERPMPKRPSVSMLAGLISEKKGVEGEMVSLRMSDSIYI